MAAESASEPRIYKLLIAAIGGQGGNVLAEWIFTAARLKGYEARFFSLPGLAQRGGATNYYLELAAGGTPEELAEVNFSAHPMPGDIDVIVGQEILETGRLLQQGFGSDHTTILTSTTRIFTALEKMPMSGGVFDQDQLLRLTAEFSENVYAFDAVTKVRAEGLPEVVVNSLLLGGLCETRVLPFEEADFLRAIDAVGVAPAPNKRGFALGRSVVRDSVAASEAKASSPAGLQLAVDAHAEQLLPAAARAYRGIVKEAQAQFPSNLHAALAEALYQLIDYQNVEYARNYVTQLAEVLAFDRQHGGEAHEFVCTLSVARHLAALMTYEDGIRVADFKTRASRFRRIEEEMQLSGKQLYNVVDYLKPEYDEIYGILPNAIVEPALRLGRRLGFVAGNDDERGTLEQHVTTTHVFGYLQLWIMARLRFLRPHSHRYHREMQIIRDWRDDIEEFLPIDYQLGYFAAQSAQLVKGYGRVRRRMVESRRRLIANVLRPLTQTLRESDGEVKAADFLPHLNAALQLCLKDEKGITQAEAAAAGAGAAPDEKRAAPSGAGAFSG